MEFPLDKETMRSFLGMINYLNRYSALSAHLTAPLSALTHQAVGYKPGKVPFENFNRLKLEISNIKALPYLMSMQKQPCKWMFPRRDLEHVSSTRGMSCYASRVLTKTEQNYQFGMRGTRN